MFQRCGITQVLRVSSTVTLNYSFNYVDVQMETKDVIWQEIMLFDAITSISKLLDQLSSGLRSLGVLCVMRAFPDLFIHLFTYTANVTSIEVLDTLYVNKDIELLPSDNMIMSHLRKFIEISSEQG